MEHIPVLLQESLEKLNIKAGDKIIDATIGLGGHSEAFAEIIGPTGLILGLDADEQAVKEAKDRLKEIETPLKIIHSNFRFLERVWKKEIGGWADVIFFDLGFNSSQLLSGRGFSFDSQDRLLMTYSVQPENELTAWEIVNEWAEENLADIIYGFGGETYSRKIAANIIKKRKEKPINTAKELAEIIMEVKKRSGKIHPATKTFQAIRIAVNDEINSLRLGLQGAWNVLKEGGHLGVISFHGLEAREVREFFKEKQRAGLGERINPKVTKPSRPEILNNPRSRSAQLRVIKKII
ncbi:MAG TPA: 16S rRNA (cytosine(1402)-N(4))-methyltransferase RsmH [Candidatus Atribacteria bacterium]|nr:16S rRNA (cytosine(1402)-N(4))-methyltransferase RsmH [Candidatus Atribacteria bacterium]